MIENYAVGASDEGSHSKAPNNKHSSRGYQFLQRIRGKVNTIMGTTEKWATLRNKQRAHLRSIMAINSPTKWPRRHEDWQINFSTHEENIVHDNENNHIFISPIIHNFQVDRILIEDGRVVEVFIYDAFMKMNLDESLSRLVGLIYGFANQPIRVKRLINLPITLWTRDNVVKK